MFHIIMRLVVLCLMPLSSYTQISRHLEIGDSIPDLNFNKIFNKPKTSISFHDFKGKLILLDFWNKWCIGCVKAFPKIENLQQEFGDQIKIVLVTNDKKEDLQKLFKRIKLPDLPIIYEDVVLNQMFPHATVPHHVWINPNGIVQFVTDGENATKENILKVLQGQEVNLHVKREVNDFQDDASLWQEGNGRLQKYITSYSFGMSAIAENTSSKWSIIKDTINKTIGFKFLNVSLLELYKMAFGNSIYYSEFKHDNRVVFDLPENGNDLKISPHLDTLSKWAEANLVCFESKWKEIEDSAAYKYLQEDVNKFFPYMVRIEEREVLCYSLHLANNFNLQKSITKKAIIWDNEKFALHNMPLSVLVESLNGLNILETIPVINETNFYDNIDIGLEDAFGDINKLKVQLFKNGLLLTQEKRMLKMLVISKKILWGK